MYRRKQHESLLPLQQSSAPAKVIEPAPEGVGNSVLSQPAPHADEGLSAKSVLRLQRRIGNQAVMRLLAAPERAPDTQGSGTLLEQSALDTGAQGPVERGAAATIQRAPTGIAEQTSVDTFASAIYTQWKDPAHKDDNFDTFAECLVKTANASLKAISSWPCKHATYSKPGNPTRGLFDRTTWTININTGSFSTTATKVGDLKQAEVAAIVDTIFHEARHSEQYFRMARIKAGKGDDAKKIATDLSIDETIADEAKKAKIEGAAAKAQIDQAAGWEDIAIGKYATYKGQVNQVDDEVDEVVAAFKTGDATAQLAALKTKLAPVEKRMKDFFSGEQTKIEAIKAPDAMDTRVLKHVKDILKAFNDLKAAYDTESASKTPDLAKLKTLASALSTKTFGAYWDHEHEIDARATGGAAKDAFNTAAKKAEKKKK